MAAQWYYDSNGQQIGPCPETQLQGLIQSGQLRGKDLVWRQGMADWMPLKSVPELARFVSHASGGHVTANPRRPAAAARNEYEEDERRPRRRSRADEYDDDDEVEDEDDDDDDRPSRRHTRGRRSKREVGLSSNEWLMFSILFVLIPAANVLVSSILYYVWKKDKPKKAGQINMLGFIVFGFHAVVYLLIRVVLGSITR